MAKPCPSCKKDVPDDARACPHCPYSFPEEPDDPCAPPTSVGTLWSPVPLIMMLLVLGVMAGAWWTVIHYGKRSRKDDAEDVTAAFRSDAPPKTSPAKAAPVSGLDEPVPSVKPEMPPRLREAVEKVEDEEEGGGGVVVSHEEDSKPEAPVKEWKMRGYVYDLLTLNPVSRGKLVFTDVQTNARFETATDQTGRYRVILPPLPGRGYTVSVSQAGYASAYLDPGTENVPKMPESQRRELCRDLDTAVLQPAELLPHGSDPLVTNFYIAPSGVR